MSGGKRHRANRAPAFTSRKGSLLGADERQLAMRLKRQRMSVEGIARALGRSVPDVQEFLNSPEAQHG